MEEELKHILIDDFKTNKGDKIERLKISYQIFGQTLGNSPVILVNHALTGNSLLTGKNGWWKDIVGEKKTIDTNKFTVLCFNIPGNGFNENNFDFSLNLDLGDIASLFIRALDKLNIKKLYAITGGSIGGCITWEIIAINNDIADIIIPIACDWKANDWLIANTYLQDRILENSRDPVADARIHAMTFYRTPKSLNERFARSTNLERGIYNVESWLDHHGIKLHERFSLKSYKFLNKLLRSSDITRDGDSFENKTKKIKAKIHIISVDSDLFFLANEDKISTNILKRNKIDVKNHIIESIHGHDAFLIETDQISNIFNKILQ